MRFMSSSTLCSRSVRNKLALETRLPTMSGLPEYVASRFPTLKDLDHIVAPERLTSHPADKGLATGAHGLKQSLGITDAV
jgi:hypothetical protein